MPEYETFEHDVLIIGAGGAGLRAAIEAPAAGVRDGMVWRQGVNEKRSTAVLANVKRSAMKPDDRQRVKAWRWEIELQTKRTNATLRPLFTFVAVPAQEVAR